MNYGYARVSTVGQAKDGNSLDEQTERLNNSGCDVIISEAYTGKTTDRPKFSVLMSELKSGDTLTVCKLDRFARSTVEGLNTIRELYGRGVRVNILNMGVIEDTLTGNLILTVLLAFAEYERGMINERTSEGKRVKKESDPNYREGRPKIEKPDFQKFLQKQKEGLMTVDECCKELGVSRSWWYNNAKSCA